MTTPSQHTHARTHAHSQPIVPGCGPLAALGQPRVPRHSWDGAAWPSQVGDLPSTCNEPCAQARCEADPTCAGYVRWDSGHHGGAWNHRLVHSITGVHLSAPGSSHPPHCMRKRTVSCVIWSHGRCTRIRLACAGQGRVSGLPETSPPRVPVLTVWHARSCPAHAVGAGVCRCVSGYHGTPAWSSSSWTHTCTAGSASGSTYRLTCARARTVSPPPPLIARSLAVSVCIGWGMLPPSCGVGGKWRADGGT